MNKLRRKEIFEIQGLLKNAQALFEESMERLETVRDEEQEYLDNMPESLQDGEKGETAQENIDNLESALDSLEPINEEIDDVLEYLDSASE